MPRYYPIYLDVQDRRAVVFGGNHEGERKVKYLLDCGAEVALFSPEGGTTEELKSLAAVGRIKWEKRGYRPGDLQGAWVAIVADTSDPAVNQAVYDEAAERNIVLNVMDVTHMCTFIAPAIIHRHDVTVAVSTAGTSPALARRLRERMSDPSYCRCLQWADMGPMFTEARKDVRSRDLKVTPDEWQEVITDELLATFRAGDIEKARRMLIQGLETKAAARA